MMNNKIVELFKRYTEAFNQYNLEQVSECYSTPCTLTTPDKFVLLNDLAEFSAEFSDIFSQLKAAKTKTFKISKASR